MLVSPRKGYFEVIAMLGSSYDGGVCGQGLELKALRDIHDVILWTGAIKTGATAPLVAQTIHNNEMNDDAVSKVQAFIFVSHALSGCHRGRSQEPNGSADGCNTLDLCTGTQAPGVP